MSEFEVVSVWEARPGDIATLKRPLWPAEVRAEVYEDEGELFAAGWLVLDEKGAAGEDVVSVARPIPELPTEVGTLFFADLLEVDHRDAPKRVLVSVEVGGDFRYRIVGMGRIDLLGPLSFDARSVRLAKVAEA